MALMFEANFRQEAPKDEIFAWANLRTRLKPRFQTSFPSLVGIDDHESALLERFPALIFGRVHARRTAPIHDALAGRLRWRLS